MFNLGPWELAIVGIVAILLFGQRLPEVMRSLGKSYNEFRKGLSDIQSSITYADYNSPSTSTSYSSSRSAGDYDDYDEPTAPKFEAPPVSNDAVPSDAVVASGDIPKPIGEK